MPFGESRTSGFSNPPLARIIVANSILTKNGLFFYSGKPAANNMVESVGVAVAGTDKFGNAYQTGDTTYVNIGGSFVATQLIGSSVTYYTAATEAGPWTQVAVLTYSVTAGAFFLNTTAPVVIGNSGPLTTAKFEVQGAIQNTGLAPITANGNLVSQVGDIIASAGNFLVDSPATKGLRPRISGVLETWHVIGAASEPPFLNSFSAGGTAPRFQLEPINGGRVRLSGAVNTGAVNAAGTAMFTLPVGYRPSRTINFVTQNNITAYTLGSGSVEVHVTGDVVCVPATTAGKFVLIDGICFELD